MPKYEMHRRDVGELFITQSLEANSEEEGRQRLENGEGEIVKSIFRPTNKPQPPELFSFKEI